MHELGLADAMLKTVRSILDEEGGGTVVSVTVSVGDLSGVVPGFLSEAWIAVTDRTPFEGVPLEIETVPGIARCMDCSHQFEVDKAHMRCPSCGGVKLIPVSGRDMTIEQIAVL